MSPKTTARPVAVAVALLAVYTLWGSTYLGIRFAEETMPPLLMGFLRFVVAGGAMVTWAVLRQPRGSRMPSGAQLRAAAVTGTALLFAGNGGVIWAEQHIPSGIAAIVVALVPLHMAWLDRVFHKQPVSRWTVLGIVAGFAGMVVLVQPSGGNHIDLGGVAVVLVGSFCWAAGSIYARSAPLPRSVAMSSGVQMLVAAVLLGLAGLAGGEAGAVHLGAISVKSWLAVGWLVVAGSLIGFSAYAWLIRNARTSLVSTYAYVNPVVAVLLGAALASEPLTARTLIAGAIILSGVAMIVARPARRRVAPTTPPPAPPEPAVPVEPVPVGAAAPRR